MKRTPHSLPFLPDPLAVDLEAVDVDMQREPVGNEPAALDDQLRAGV